MNEQEEFEFRARAEQEAGTVSPPYSSDEFERSSAYPTAAMTDTSIQDYQLAKGVGGLAAKGIGMGLNATPFTKNILPTIDDTADDMLLKSMGTKAAQARQVGGIEAARDAAKVARKAGAGDIFSTERGSREALKQFTEQEGKKIGSLREAAGKAPDYYKEIEGELVKRYNPSNADVFSAQAPKVQEGINTVRNIASEAEPTHVGIAKGITGLNKFASGEKLRQPVNALTDVANKLSQKNTAGIVQTLGPDKGKDYLEALHNERGAFQLEPFMERGAEREALSRGGGNILSSMIQKIADSGGYRATAKGLDALKDTMTGPMTPDALKSLAAYLSEKYGGSNADR